MREAELTEPPEKTNIPRSEPQDGMWVTAMTDDCLDDLVPPPGGGVKRS